MRHTIEQPEISADEMLTIEHKTLDYIIPKGTNPTALYRAYCRDFEARYLGRYPCIERGKQEYAMWFIFECGRIFGIRMERMKRRGHLDKSASPADAAPLG